MRVSIREAMKIARDEQNKKHRKEYDKKYVRTWSDWRRLQGGMVIKTMVAINMKTDTISCGAYPVLYGMGRGGKESNAR